MMRRTGICLLTLLVWLACAGALAEGRQPLRLGNTGYVLGIPAGWKTAAPAAGYTDAFRSPGGEKMQVAVVGASMEEIWSSYGCTADGYYGGVYWIFGRDAAGRTLCCTQLTDTASVLVAFDRSPDPAVLSALSRPLE